MNFVIDAIAMEISVTPYVIMVLTLFFGAGILIFFLSLFLAEWAFHKGFRRMRFLVAFPFLLVVSWLLAAFPVSVIADFVAARRWYGWSMDAIFPASMPIVSLLALLPFAILSRRAEKFFGVTWRQSTAAAALFIISVLGLSFAAYWLTEVRQLPETALDIVGGEYRDLGYGYERNRLLVKYHEEPMRQADPGTFSVLGKNQAKDRYRVYMEDKHIAPADASTYRLLEQSMGRTIFAVDRNHGYYDAKPISDDPEHFEILAVLPVGLDDVNDEDRNPDRTIYMTYARDSKRIYWNGVPIHPEADPGTFRVLSSMVGADDHALYAFSDRKIECECDFPTIRMINAQNGIVLDRKEGIFFLYGSPDLGSFQFFDNGFKQDGIFHYYDDTPMRDRSLPESADSSIGQRKLDVPVRVIADE